MIYSLRALLTMGFPKIILLIRDSKDWMMEAKAAAAAGSWRDAIHLSYWAGISFLEGRGVWHPDRARTPREYLRLLPSSAEYHKPLAALTRQFEMIWYGGTAAGPDSFSEALKHLESLGCPIV